LSYYIILPILESSIIFSVLHNHVTCDCKICDHLVTGVTLCDLYYYHIILYHTLLSKFKIKKIKLKNKINEK